MRSGCHYSTRMLLAGAILIAAMHELSAQRLNGLYLGAYCVVAGGWPNAGFPVFADQPEQEEFTTGTSRSWMFGGMLHITDLPLTGMDLVLRAGWGETSQRFSAIPLRPFWTFDPERNTDIEIAREFVLESRFHSMQFQGVLEYHPVSRLGIGIGLAAGYRFGLVTTQYEHVTGPDGYSFSDGNTTRALAASSYQIKPLMVAPLLSAAWQLPLGERLALSLDIDMRYDLVAATDVMLREGLSVGGGMTILFNTTPPLPAPVLSPPQLPAELPTPSVVEIARPQRRRLSSAIDLYAVDRNGGHSSIGVLEIDDSEYHTTFMLPDFLPFTSLSAETHPYYNLLSREQADRFSLDSLATANADTTGRQILNMLGLLLQQQPGTRLLVAGSAGSGELQTVAVKRAEELRRYLAGTWDIDTSRMQQVTPAALTSGSEQRSGVYISVSGNNVIGGLGGHAVVQHITPPQIRLDPAYQADAGLAGWQLALINEGETIASYSDTSSEKMGLDMRILYDRLPNDTSRLIATFIVTDSTGWSTTSVAELPLVIRRHHRIVERHLDPALAMETIRIIQPFAGTDSTIAASIAKEVEHWAGAGSVIYLVVPVDDNRIVQSQLVDRLRGVLSRAIELRTIPRDQWQHLAARGGANRDAAPVVITIEKRLTLFP